MTKRKYSPAEIRELEIDLNPYQPKRGMDGVEVAVLVIAVLIFFFGVLVGKATGAESSLSTASWYGPGLYGNQVACGGTLTPGTWGVAHKFLPCGTRLKLCYSTRCTTARVIDRGPFVYGRTFDLTGPVARYLCRCRDWGVRYVAWRRIMP